MNLYKSKLYCSDLEEALSSVPSLERLRGSSVLIGGATGLIGSFLTDMLLAYGNHGGNVHVYAMGRSLERLQKRFEGVRTDFLHLVEHDVTNPLCFDFQVDYIINAASNAYPASFNLDPVGTIMGNILGTRNMLDFGREKGMRRFLYVSSGEVYGQGEISSSPYVESYSGYVDPMSARSCYPNGKRAAETLCAAYSKQYDVDVVVGRPCHTYGPNVTASDNRANVQFVNNVLKGEDIVLKSAGLQERSYCYVADCASALLTVLLEGEKMEAYNIANQNSVVTIAEFAKEVAEQAGRKLVYAEPDKAALAERTPIMRQVLDAGKLVQLGWNGKFSLKKGISHTLNILKGE